MAASSNALIHTASMKVGDKTLTVLKDPKGRTLYYFTPDTATTVACTGGCASNWPPLIATSGTPTSTPALPGQLTVMSGANGNQVLYNGHPLYTYVKDGDAGDAYGQGVGGKWFVATPGLAAAAHLSCVDYLGDVPWDEDEMARNWYARVKSRPSFRGLLADRVPGMAPAGHYADLDF